MFKAMTSLIALCSIAFSSAMPAWGEQAAGETLVVFVQATDGEIGTSFQSDVMPDVQAIASEMELDVEVVDVAVQGAPEGVHLTPLMVYMNHRGRFPYLGRFTTTDRLRNHIRTARFGAAPEDVRSATDRVPRRSLGRAVLGMPIKITPMVGPGVNAVVTGEATPEANLPTRADLTQVDGSPMMTMHLGPFSSIQGAITVALGDDEGIAEQPMDRLFYVDFYPYLAADGTLFVSTALFSQFHCHEAVYVGEEPVSGHWSEANEVFAKAASQLAEEIDRQLGNPELGDGFDAIAADVKPVEWESLGLGLPDKPEGPVVDLASLELVRDWQVDQEAVSMRPVVQFRFPDPIVGYAGEAQELKGSVTLGEGLTLADATGEFIVPVTSVTMGEPDLDSYMHSGMLNGGSYPESKFTFDRIEVPDGAVPAFGQVIPGKLIGKFKLMEVTIELTVPVSIEAFAGDDGQPRLAFAGSWVIGPLDETFGIEDAPPGPDEQAKRLKFDCYIVLEPRS